MSLKLSRGRPPQRIVADPSVTAEACSWGSWQHSLLPEERAVYEHLRHCSLDGTRSGVARLEQAGRCSKRRLRDIFAVLESCGFLACQRWGKVIPMLVIVKDIPPRPPLLETARNDARVLRKQHGVDGGEVANLIAIFAEEYEKRKGSRYRILRGKDHGVAKHLLQTYDLDTLRRYIIHFFRIFPPPHTLGALSTQINNVAASFNATKEKML